MTTASDKNWCPRHYAMVESGSFEVSPDIEHEPDQCPGCAASETAFSRMFPDDSPIDPRLLEGTFFGILGELTGSAVVKKAGVDLMTEFMLDEAAKILSTPEGQDMLTEAMLDDATKPDDAPEPDDG